MEIFKINIAGTLGQVRLVHVSSKINKKDNSLSNLGVFFLNEYHT